jgi:hypothetical protein
MNELWEVVLLCERSTLVLVVVGLPVLLFWGIGLGSIFADRWMPHSDAEWKALLESKRVRGGLLAIFHSLGSSFAGAGRGIRYVATGKLPWWLSGAFDILMALRRNDSGELEVLAARGDSATALKAVEPSALQANSPDNVRVKGASPPRASFGSYPEEKKKTS